MGKMQEIAQLRWDRSVKKADIQNKKSKFRELSNLRWDGSVKLIVI
jgi:hypothetical protein